MTSITDHAGALASLISDVRKEDATNGILSQYDIIPRESESSDWPKIKDGTVYIIIYESSTLWLVRCTGDLSERSVLFFKNLVRPLFLNIVERFSLKNTEYTQPCIRRADRNIAPF